MCVVDLRRRRSSAGSSRQLSTTSARSCRLGSARLSGRRFSAHTSTSAAFTVSVCCCKAFAIAVADIVRAAEQQDCGFPSLFTQCDRNECARRFQSSTCRISERCHVSTSATAVTYTTSCHRATQLITPATCVTTTALMTSLILTCVSSIT